MGEWRMEKTALDSKPRYVRQIANSFSLKACITADTEFQRGIIEKLEENIVIKYEQGKTFKRYFNVKEGEAQQNLKIIKHFISNISDETGALEKLKEGVPMIQIVNGLKIGKDKFEIITQ